MQTFLEWTETIPEPDKAMPIPPDVRKLYHIFTSSGHVFYIAGGAVRDFVLGKKPKDYDLATDATPDEVKAILDKFGFNRTEQVGEQFGVVIAKGDDGEDYEIATFRTDEIPGRQTQVKFIRDPKMDAQRRDLTMNALFYDIGEEKIIDYVGGEADIKAGRVRTVGNPMERFGEDPLRVLRLIRFHCRFNPSMKGIDQHTYQSMQYFIKNGLTDKLGKQVPPERVRDEFKKGIQSAKIPVNFITLYDKLGILKQYLLPGFAKYNTNFINDHNPHLVIASILKYNKVDEQFTDTLRADLVDNADVDRVLYYLNMLNLKRDTKFFGQFNDTKPEKTQEKASATLLNLIRNKPDISDDELARWARWFHMPLELAQKFRDYSYRGKVSEVPGAENIPPSPLLGRYIKRYNVSQALNHINRSPGFKEWYENINNNSNL